MLLCDVLALQFENITIDKRDEHETHVNVIN